MMRLNPRNAASATVAAALLCSVGLTACTNAKDAKDAAQSAASAPAAKVSTKQPSPLPADPSFDGSVAGAASDLKITDCPKGEGKQTAKGTLTNSSKDKRDYAVMIIWLKNGNGTPLGSGLQIVKGLGPGESRDISITADVVAQADVCTPNVHAGAIKG